MDSMEKKTQPESSLRTFKVLPDTTLRRLRYTPSYFFLVWRWSMWLYALVITGGYKPIYSKPSLLHTALILLGITLAHTLLVTLYAPISQILLPNFPRIESLRLRHYLPVERLEGDILTPLASTHSRYWNLTIYAFDVLICGVVMYFGGPLGNPPFGVGSIFYRYGMSTAFGAALAYRYPGALFASLGYMLFVILGIVLPAPGAPPYTPNIVDVTGSLIDTPVAALLAAYLASLLAKYARSKKEVQDHARRQQALRNVWETIVRDAHDKETLLQRSAQQIRQGGHFQRLILAYTDTHNSEETSRDSSSTLHTSIEVSLPHISFPPSDTSSLEQALHTQQKVVHFEPPTTTHASDVGFAQLYLPFVKEGRVQLVLGAEGRRRTPFDTKQELFLTLAGSQLLIALENIHLTEQTVHLAAIAERGRIAREIHDGIAQLIYMLSLNIETSATQAHRIAAASEEDADVLSPLAHRLDTLVALSKQALWEIRTYMFTLKPLMEGTTTLTHMLTNQLREFEAISNVSVHLQITGDEMLAQDDEQRRQKQARAGAAIFRIVQEALTNAYKHAKATLIEVHLHFTATDITVEIGDNGHGMQTSQTSSGLTVNAGQQRAYTGRGLQGMRERAEELDGTFVIAHTETGGVKIRLWIPI